MIIFLNVNTVEIECAVEIEQLIFKNSSKFTLFYLTWITLVES